MKELGDCSLVINVSLADAAIIQHTLPHQLSSLKAVCAEAIIVVDARPTEGRISAQNQFSPDALSAALADLKQSGFDFQTVPVDYAPTTVSRVFKAWFGHDRVTLRCAGGTPIYAFLFGLEQARCRYRLHLDSDMLLYDPGPRSWLQEGITILDNSPEVLFVNQTHGPNNPSGPAHEFLAPRHAKTGLRLGQTFSTRCFLFDAGKLSSGFLPLTAVKHPLLKALKYRLQSRSPYVALEQMIAHRLRATGGFRCDLEDSFGFTLHAWDKQVFSRPEIGVVIHEIERGRVPSGQVGLINLEFERYLQT